MHGAVEVSCQVLNGTNKVGLLKKNEKGYYPMIVGALNMVNNKKEYYEYSYAKKFFDEASDLVRMASKGMLIGELGHPKQGMLPDDKFIERLLQCEETNQVCHHRRIWLDFDNFKDKSGRPFIGIMSEVAPSGPYGPSLEKQLNNPEENVAFSIRCFSLPHRVGGRVIKEMKHVVTFDKVTEPGIEWATKYNAPSLESHAAQIFTQGRVLEAARNIRSTVSSNEAANLPITALIGALGWEVRDTPQAKRNFFELLNTPKL
jgi:hypothetical protein